MQLEQVLREKTQPINTEEFKKMLIMYFSFIEESDLESMIAVHVPKEQTLSRAQCLYVQQLLLSESRKLERHNTNLTCFQQNGIASYHDGVITSKTIDCNMDFNADFREVLGEQFYRKLINYGASGLIFEKLEVAPHRRYSFFQWIQHDLQISINQQGDHLYLQLLKQIWSFKFKLAEATLQKIKISYPKDDEISSVEIGLKLFSQMYSLITENEELKDVFMDRKEFNIKFQDEHTNKLQQSDFNSKINEIKQQLLFSSTYFHFIKKDYKNKYYYAIAHFLCNRDDNFVKENDQIINIEQISITDRYAYARKFFRAEDLENFHTKLKENYLTVSDLDYIILFGAGRESETILQNYIDQTNDIQKAALASVYLKIFLQQGRSRQVRLAFYNRIIKTYENLLIRKDSGISKHKFDQKCVTIQVQRKKKTMNKTFYFNCLQCGNGQCLLSITKRITNDSKQHQIRMKGNNYFAKDPRHQVMYCLDCMYMLAKCSVCLIPITVYNGYAEELKKNNSITTQKQKNCGQSLSNSLVWCPQCFHGGHFAHIMKWMQRSQKRCPVASCKCKCSL